MKAAFILTLQQYSEILLQFKLFSILLYFKMLNDKAEFSSHYLVSHDTLETILICCFGAG